MAEPWIEALRTLLQAYVNCLELGRALEKQTHDPYVKESLGLLMDGLQESLASLAGHLRRQGLAPGTYELDRQGKAKIRGVLATRSLREQLLAVRRDLADLAAWYDVHVPPEQTDQATRNWLESLSSQARRMLEGWEQHMHEMKAGG
ncbi:MAG: hypothetical protein P8186_18865 [Anaerolineae bacterium]|jgi:hypothetical protein